MKKVMLVAILILLVSCSIVEKEKERLTQKETEGITKEITEGVLGSDEPEPCTIPKTVPQFEHQSYYTGPLIDTHIHMPVASKIVSTTAIQAGFEDMPAYSDELSIDYLTCLFESEGITQAFGFNVVPNLVIGQSVRKVNSNAERYPDMFVQFYQPTQLPGLNPSPEKVDDILTDNPIFQGYGEVKFSFGEIDNFGIRDEEYLAAYDLADKHGLVIMMHPGYQHKEDVMFLLEKHPNVKFLFHGGESHPWIMDVLEKYPNAYYTLEPNILIFGWEIHELRSPTKEEFLAYMPERFDSFLEDQLGYWKPRIEKHPNKFLWGTDRWYTWHFDPEVGSAVEEFGRAFIGQLDESVQENFAYKNAEKIME